MIAFRSAFRGLKRKKKISTRAGVRPTSSSWLICFSRSLLGFQILQRERSLLSRLETRGRSRSPSDAMSADPNALLAFKQLNLKERVRVRIAFSRPLAPRNVPNAFSRRRRPAIRPPIGVAKADGRPYPDFPRVPDRTSSRCTARRSRSARRRSRR